MKTESLNPELEKKIKAIQKFRGSAYKPRTSHLLADGSPKYRNRLFLETSPYLLQHAHNPVDWYPWGDEAFEMAKNLKRPVLLSIGYSTCHWCHVMEEESFEDEEIANYLNQNYIAIKVDREERPDLDTVYMKAVQMLTGRGGWPMTVWLTDERKPFFGGTYFPARDGDRGHSPGFLTILQNLRLQYFDKRTVIESSCEEIINAMIPTSFGAKYGNLPNEETLLQAFHFYQTRFDSIYGGVGDAPKFPSSLPIRFLLQYWQITGIQSALDMAEKTLDAMAVGGIRDHLAGGFHRYSTDQYWLVPHFEKMLYDNALLSVAYLEAWQATGKEKYADVVSDTLNYIQREMTSPEGGFYSATDADSITPEGEREEGWFFTWSTEELDKLLGNELSTILKTCYSVGNIPNFEGRHIFHITKSLSQIGEKLKLSEEQVKEQLKEAKKQLLKERQKRSLPLRDDKILTAWNGLMISAFAKSGFALNRPEWIESAKKATNFILENLRSSGRLHRSYKDNQVAHKGFLDDYVFMISALLDLYESTGETPWLEEAIALDRQLEDLFEDKEEGGFFMTGNDHEKLISREKPSYDGEIPSGNSTALSNLLRLYGLTTDERYRKRAETLILCFSKILKESPWYLAEMLPGLNMFLNQLTTIVVITPKGSAKEDSFLEILRSRFLPNKVVVMKSEEEEQSEKSPIESLIRDKKAIEGKTTIYPCRGTSCEKPITNPDQLVTQL